MKDPYHLLNIARDADPEVIKQAYRKLAKQLHPDQNPGDKKTEQRFKDVTQAYTLLSDQKARRDYDRGRISAHGQRQRQSFGRTAASCKGAGWWSQGIEMIFDRMLDKFGHAARGRADSDPEQPSGTPAAGEPHHRLEVDFRTAVLGGRQRMTRADGKALEVDIPPGTEDNVMLRLKGQGRSASSGKSRGDLLVQIRVLDHPLFTRRGQDLYLDLPVSLKEALLGAKVRTPTIEGAVSLSIPAKANSGQMLRLKGKGVADRVGKRGDQYVRLLVMLPKEPNMAMAADLERLAGYDDEDVRAHLDG